MRQYQKATIKDVAAQAGVSVTTVSHFVSGRSGTCAPQTAQRIRAAIDDLQYTPSYFTRGLRPRPTRILGACVTNPSDLQGDQRHSRLERLWRGLIEVADETDYSLLHYPASVRYGTTCDMFLNGSVDGVFFNSTHGDPRPQKTAAAGLPTLLFNRLLEQPPGCGAVYAREADTVALALSHLWQRGHRRIAHLAGPVEPSSSEVVGDYAQSDIAIERQRGYIAWLTERTAFDPDLLLGGRAWLADHAAAAVARWRALPDPPTAVFCANDALAIGVINAARALNWRVPADLSVVGVDNTAATSESDPPLTTVDIPAETIGREALRALLRLMDGAPAEACRIVVPVTDLVVRASTGPPPPR